MRNTDTIVRTLYDSACENGLIRTLEAVFGSRCVLPLPLSTAVCEAPVTELMLRSRGGNGLMRMKLNNIGELTDMIAENRLASVRNIGDKTVREIKTALVTFVWGQLDEEDKMELLREILLRNASCSAPAGRQVS